MRLSLLKKLLWGIGPGCLVFGLLGLIVDLKLNSTQFMKDNEIKVAKRIDDRVINFDIERNLASDGESHNLIKNHVGKSLVTEQNLPKGVKRPKGQTLKVRELEMGKTKNLNLPTEMELMLNEVFYQNRAKNLQTEADIFGQLKINNDEIKILTARFVGQDLDEVNIEIRNVKIENNYFRYQIEGDNYTVSGMIFRSSPEEYIVTLVNGPYIGTKLIYMTEEKIIHKSSEVENRLTEDLELHNDDLEMDKSVYSLEGDKNLISNEDAQIQQRFYNAGTKKQDLEDLENDDFVQTDPPQGFNF